MNYILGINCSGFHSSACLMQNGKLLFAITEERLTRVKQDISFPHKAIAYCLDAAAITIADVTDAFVGWNPRFYLQKSDNVRSDAMQNRGKIAQLALNELATIPPSELTSLEQTLAFGNHKLNIHYVDHHKAHLANAFFQSGFKDADFLALDGFGEVTTGLVGSINRDLTLSTHNEFPTPHSLGLFYSAFTDFLGFKPNGDEWKVMALAALGNPGRHIEAVRSLIRTDELNLEFDLSYFEHFLSFRTRYFSKKFVAKFGPPLSRGAPVTQEYCDIVASVQQVVEETVFKLLNSLHKKTQGKRLILAGGFFMNSVCNGKVTKCTPYQDIYIGGSPDDSGISVGSAYYGTHYTLGKPVEHQAKHQNFFGKTYSSQEIERELSKRKIKFSVIESPAKIGAKLIAEGKILGWFQGGSEFGQRALGNRSIVADPRRKDVKDLINSAIKYREGFRPFAPAVLKEKQHEIFECRDGETSYFMERVYQFHPTWKDRVPGVVHNDGTGRLQTVCRSISPKFHDLIAAFEALSGVPIVLNTSFNINGMPLVESPGDAITCFYASGMDALILDHYLVEKGF